MSDDERHFKARVAKEKPVEPEQSAVVEALRPVDIVCTSRGDGGYSAVPQTPAGTEFLRQFFWHPAEYKGKDEYYALEISFSMQAQFRGMVAASGLNVVIND